ncbi:MAG: hypothetical protein AAFU79_00570 [Myxococcota bacterium]
MPEEGAVGGDGTCQPSSTFQTLGADVSVSSSYSNLPGQKRYAVGRSVAAFIAGDGVHLIDVSSPPEVRLLTDGPVTFSGFQPLFVEVVDDDAVVVGTLQPEDTLGWFVLREPVGDVIVPKPLANTSDFLAHLSVGAGCFYLGSSRATYALDLEASEEPILLQGDLSRLAMTPGGRGVATFDLVESLGPSGGCALRNLGSAVSGDLVASRADQLWTLRGDRFLQFTAQAQRYEVDLNRTIADLYPSQRLVVVGADRDVFVFEDTDPALDPRPLNRLPLLGQALAIGPVGGDDDYVAAFVALPEFAGPGRVALEVARLDAGCR